MKNTTGQKWLHPLNVKRCFERTRKKRLQVKTASCAFGNELYDRAFWEILLQKLPRIKLLPFSLLLLKIEPIRQPLRREQIFSSLLGLSNGNPFLAAQIEQNMIGFFLPKTRENQAYCFLEEIKTVLKAQNLLTSVSVIAVYAEMFDLDKSAEVLFRELCSQLSQGKGLNLDFVKTSEDKQKNK